jgi:type II secretory pathway pseudopilin PulG
MIQTVLLVILSVLSTAFAFLFYIQRKKNIQIIAQTVEFFMLQEAQQEQMKTDKEKANEDFLKFVSDSRDWAYQYIEEVQFGLKLFIDEVGPQVEHYDKYGPAVDGMVAPHDFALKKISKAYKELKKLLPDDYGRIDA